LKESRKKLLELLKEVSKEFSEIDIDKLMRDYDSIVKKRNPPSKEKSRKKR